MELVWYDKMSVGNETIDSEHKQILALINEVERVIRTKDSLLVSQVLQNLEDTTRAHFKNEEKIADAIHFPFDEHHLEHQYILEEFENIKTELLANPERWSESIAEHYFMFLSTWATEHILEDDMKMKPILEMYPYDYMPTDLIGQYRYSLGKQNKT